MGSKPSTSRSTSPSSSGAAVGKGGRHTGSRDGGLPDNAVRLCDVEEFPECTSRLVRLPGREYAVWRQHGQEFYALDNACYHHGSPLLPKAGSLRKVGDRLCVSCPWHGYKIAVDNGEGLYYGLQKDMKTQVLKSKGSKQRPHRVLVSGGGVFLVPSTNGSHESDQYYSAQSTEQGSKPSSEKSRQPSMTDDAADVQAKTVTAKLRSRGACNESGSTTVLTFMLDAPLKPAPIPGVHADFQINPKRGASPEDGGVMRSWTILSYSSTSVAVAVREKKGGSISPWILHKAPLGTPVTVRAALEAEFVLPPVLHGEPPPLLLAGGGVGITPLLAMLRFCFSPHMITPAAAPTAEDLSLGNLQQPPGWHAVLVYSERHEEDFCFRFELDELADGASHLGGTFKVVYRLTGDPADNPGWSGSRGRITADVLSEACGGDAKLKDYMCYLCGPGNFAETLRGGLVDRGVPEQRIMAESFE